MRFLLLFLIGGGFLVFFGVQEFMVSRDAAETPVDVVLEKLEAGEPLPNNHARIGQHIALFSDAVFSYQKPNHSNDPPGPSSRLNYVFYPVLSNDHPYWPQLDEFVRKNGPQADPKNGPPVGKIAVLVKTYRFKTLSELPQTAGPQESVKGLVINRISSLKSDEQKLVEDAFPGTSLKEVLILEEDRAPASAFKWLGLIGGGVVLLLIALGVFIRSRQS